MAAPDDDPPFTLIDFDEFIKTMPEPAEADVGTDAHTEAPETDADHVRSNGEEGQQHRRGKAVRLAYFDQFIDGPIAKQWIIKNVIARGEVSSWFGPPGVGKSALLTSVAIAAASADKWRNYRTKEACGVVYFAFERADLECRRFSAHRRRDSLEGLPIAVAGELIDMMSPRCIEIIIATIRQAEEVFGHKVGLIIIDTFNKGIAIGGGDENSAKDQNRALANLRKVVERTNVHIACVGHTGKDESKGQRGSNAPKADADLEVQITGDDGAAKTATVIKANDQPLGPLTAFRLEPFELGKDEDGDPVPIYIIANEIIITTRSKKLERPLKGNPKIALDALQMALDEAGAVPEPSNHIPANVRTVPIEIWRKYAYAKGISTGEKRAKQKAFERSRVTLINGKYIAEWNEQVWTCAAATQPTEQKEKE
jgi:hypothetical protein